MDSLISEEEFRSLVGRKRVVNRDKYKDKASAFNISQSDIIRTRQAFDAVNIWYGRDVQVKPHFKINICDQAQLIIGDRCIFNEYSFLQLTMPGPRVVIGDWVSLGRHTILAAKQEIIIGSYTQIGPFCHILDQGHRFDRSELILNQEAVLGRTVIGQDCWLGTSVKILKGVNISDGCVIGAGSVVTKDIPPYEIWAGVPAKFIKKRE